MLHLLWWWKNFFPQLVPFVPFQRPWRGKLSPRARKLAQTLDIHEKHLKTYWRFTSRSRAISVINCHIVTLLITRVLCELTLSGEVGWGVMIGLSGGCKTQRFSCKFICRAKLWHNCYWFCTHCVPLFVDVSHSRKIYLWKNEIKKNRKNRWVMVSGKLKGI